MSGWNSPIWLKKTTGPALAGPVSRSVVHAAVRPRGEAPRRFGGRRLGADASCVGGPLGRAREPFSPGPGTPEVTSSSSRPSSWPSSWQPSSPWVLPGLRPVQGTPRLPHAPSARPRRWIMLTLGLYRTRRGPFLRHTTARSALRADTQERFMRALSSHRSMWMSFFVLARASRCAHARTISRAHGTTSLRIAHRRIALSVRESDPSPGLSSPRDLAAARVAADTSVARAGAAMPHRHSTLDAREPARQIGPPLPL